MAYAMIAMAGLKLAGSYFASQNIRDTAELNQDIANMNAEFAELDAYDAELEGYTQQAKYQSVIDKTLSEQQAILTAADVDVNYGSVGEKKKESEFIAQLNLMEIEKRAQEKALGYERQASDYRFGGSIARSESEGKASQVMSQGILGAAESGILAAERAGLTGYKKDKKGSL